MKKETLFKLSALSLALSGQYATAAVINHTCSVSSNCNYTESIVIRNNVTAGTSTTEKFWIINSERIGNNNDDLEAQLTPQHYQNIDSDDNTQTTFDLISVSNLDSGRKAHLYIPTGTTATLGKVATGTGKLVSLYNAEGQFDQGVTLKVGTEEIDENESLLTGVSLGGNSKLNTSANIVINAYDAEGIWVKDNAQLTAKNHKIDLVAGETQGVNVADNASAVLNNVIIKGAQYSQTGLTTQELATADFNNSSIDLAHNTLTIGLGIGGGTISTDNSQISANYAVFADAYGYDTSGNFVANSNTVNLKNSNVIGRELFVGINTNEDTQPVSTNHKTAVNVLDSKVSGRIVNVKDLSDENEENELDLRLDTTENTNVFITMKNSEWMVNGNSHLDTLAMANSTTSLQKTGDKFQTLTISNDLIGNGHFNLNTDLANQQSDKIIVKGEDSGNFTLGIQDSGNEPQAANGKVTLVETLLGQATFSLKDRDYVDAGAYRYRLHQEGTNWVLANRQAEKTNGNPPVAQVQPTQPTTPVTPVAPTQPTVQPTAPTTPVVPTQPSVQPTVQPTQPSVPTAPALLALSEKTNALVSLRQAQGVLLSQHLQGIHQRLGEVRSDKSSNVWVKNLNSRSEAKAQNVAADSRSSGFEMDSHSLQIGADKAVSNTLRLGGFVGTSRADVDFNGEYGKGKLRSQAVGFYATFANEQGWYLDNIAKYERLTAESNSEKRKYNAFGISSEIGKRFALSNDWVVTPQAQLAYHTINGKADEERLNLLVARAGVRVAKGFALNNGWNLQPYAEVNGIAEKANSAKVQINQYQFEVAENKGRVQGSLGLSAGNGNHRLGLEASVTSGNKLKQPFNVLVNYRYQW